jgi:hypothetical protein
MQLLSTLRENKGLTQLDISWNKFDVEAAKHMQRALVRTVLVLSTSLLTLGSLSWSHPSSLVRFWLWRRARTRG